MITIVDCAYTIRGDGPPLFLIHEIGASYETWAKTLPVLTPHFNVITYYLCGHGASPKSYGEFSLNELVADLETLPNKRGVARAHCAGHPLGRMIGTSYSRLYKKHALSLNLLSTPAFRNANYSEKWDEVNIMGDIGIPNILPTLVVRWLPTNSSACILKLLTPVYMRS